MAPDQLSIEDRKFLVTRLIQQAPINTLVREFFKNADENAALAPEDRRIVEIYPTVIDGVRKITFYNTGVGMSAAELKTATNLSSSVNKLMSVDANFGIGAKVSGLVASPDGIRYRSCKNGEVNEVTIGYDDKDDAYVRFHVELPDGSMETIYDVTRAAVSEGRDVSYDWTEVVLMGESPEHDTVEFPIGLGRDVDRSFVATSIYRRFVSFSPGVQVRIDVSMSRGGGRGETGKTRQVRTLDEICERAGLHVEDVTDPATDITIRYIHDPRMEGTSHTTSSRNSAASGSTTFCALVYKDERYDFRTQKAWSAVAPTFGFPFGSKVMTVEIRLPDGAAMPTQYRDALMWRHDRSPLLAEHHAQLVRELMPAWVRDVIRSESPEGADDLNDLQSDLQTLLDELRVPSSIMRPAPKEPDSLLSIMEADEGVPEREPTTIEAEHDEPRTNENGRMSRPTASRAAKTRVRTAPDGATANKISRGLERAPEIKMLLTPEEVSERGLKGRAARFYAEVQTLFVNGMYPVVERMAAEIGDEFPDAEDPEEMRALATQASQRMLAFRVGKATCFALAKRLLDDWSSEDLERATSPESLSMAADDYQQSMRLARKWIKERLKVERAQALAEAA